MMLRESVFMLRSMQGLKFNANVVCFHTEEQVWAAG
jgi:hypothetical protein